MRPSTIINENTAVNIKILIALLGVAGAWASINFKVASNTEKIIDANLKIATVKTEVDKKFLESSQMAIKKADQIETQMDQIRHLLIQVDRRLARIEGKLEK